MPTPNRRPIYHRHLRRFGLLVLFPLSIASAQEFPQRDSLGGLPADSSQLAHAVRRFIPFVGSFGLPIDSSDRLHYSQFALSPAVSLTDLFGGIAGYFIRDLGQPGQPTQLFSGGSDDRTLAVLVDGRPMRDPITGATNLHEIPIESVNEIEVLGPDASMFAASEAPGGAINVVSRQYDNNRPITKLRFMQGPFEHLFTDGLFSQNVARGTNVLVGIQRQVTDGRFANSKFDSWNVRARVRYNLSERLNFWMSDLYYKSILGLNGGVDPRRSPSLYDEVTASVRDESTGLSVSRHDFTFGFAGKLLGDSVSLSRAIAYYTAMEREYSTGATQFTPATFIDLQHASVWGTRVEQRLASPVFDVKLGAEYEQRIIEESTSLSSLSEGYRAVTGSLSLLPIDWIRAKAGIRFEDFRGQSALPWNLRLETCVTDWLTLWGAGSNSFQYPTIQELYWTDTTISRAGTLGRATQRAVEFGMRLESRGIRFSIRGFKTTVSDGVTASLAQPSEAVSPIVFRKVPTLDLSGAAIDAVIRFWRLEVAGQLTFTEHTATGSNARVYPRFVSSGELFYRDMFGDDALDLKVAVRARFVSRHFGSSFVPRLGTFAQQSEVEVPGISSFDTYVAAKFGDALITFMWENPLNTQGMLVPYYPLLGRNIKLGINWLFLD